MKTPAKEEKGPPDFVVFVPQYNPGGIKHGGYTLEEFAFLMVRHKRYPQTIQFLAELLVSDPKIPIHPTINNF